MDIKLPQKILDFVSDLPYEVDEVGMSDSEVRIYDKYVLKIQRRSEETDNEYEISSFLKDKISIPSILCYEVAGDIAFTLMTKVSGKMLCDDEYLNNPQFIIKQVSEAIKNLSSVDITNCPCEKSRLKNRLKVAEYNVKNGLVDLEKSEEGTFGPDGFKDPEELLNWLISNQPEEDLVLTHGDLSLPNIFIEEGKISSFIDIGKMGPADRWQDIAIAIRSITHNFDGLYTGGKRIMDFDPKMLLDELGIEMDEQKYRYYILLDELF